MLVLVFIIGLIFGSFFILIGMRLPKGESIIYPASHCDECDKKLSIWELIPIFSYLFFKGRCSDCEQRISSTYPIIELLTAVLFTLCYALFGIGYEFSAGIIISSILIIIYVSDFKYKIILDSPLIIGSLLILVLKFIYFGFNPTLMAALSGIILFCFMFAIKFLGDKLFKRESLGWGDVKLAVFIGVVLGLKLGLTSLIVASFIAFPYALIAIHFTKEKEIPFGPFLITGLLLVFIFMDFFSSLIGHLF